MWAKVKRWLWKVCRPIFFHMLCFSGYLSIPSCPYQSLFSLVNTNFLLVYWSKQSSLFTSRLWQVYSGMSTATCSKIHTYIHLLDTDHGPSSLNLMCVCACVYSGVLIMDGGARRCLRADLTLDPVTADRHQNNFGDSHTSVLCPLHTHPQTQTVWPFLTPHHKPTFVPSPFIHFQLVYSFVLFLSSLSCAFAKH